LADVAARAGVSLATASRAMRSGHPMAAPTRRRVLDAARDLGYRPHRIRRRSGIVSILASVPGHMVMPPLLTSLQEATAEDQIATAVTTTGGDLALECRTLGQLADDPRVQGVVVVGGAYLVPHWTDRVGRAVVRLLSRNIPVVFCGRGGGDLGIPGVRVVDYDHDGGAASAVAHLAGLGHRTVGLIRGPEGFTTSDRRAAGFQGAVQRRGLDDDPGLRMTGVRSAEFAADATRELLLRRPDVTALFCESDAMAMGAMRAAHDLGRRLPEDLSVVGFDNMYGVANLIPPLTTVEVPSSRLGAHTAEVVLASEDPGPVMVPTRLVVRNSVAPAT